jgi:hypothetical protein
MKGIEARLRNLERRPENARRKFGVFDDYTGAVPAKIEALRAIHGEDIELYVVRRLPGFDRGARGWVPDPAKTHEAWKSGEPPCSTRGANLQGMGRTSQIIRRKPQ